MTEEAEDYAPTRRRKKRRGRKVTLIVLSSLLVLVIGGFVAAWMYLNSLGNTFEERAQTFEESFPEESERPEKDEDDESVNILLLGSDTGGGSGETEDLPMVPNGGRADTMMLVHIPGDRDAVYVMSIMRDLWVPIPGHGNAKINAALAIGGVPHTVQTVESLFNTRIDHVAAVDLDGFQGLVDAMGGVTVNSPESFTSVTGHNFSAGEQHMDAESAMAFVRERRAFSDGDYTRVRNQQAFMRGVLNETLSPSTLTNPGRVHDMVEEFSPYITVDESLDAGTLGSLGWQLRSVRSGSINMFTLPTNGIGRSDDGQSVVWMDEQAIDEIGQAMRDGTLDEYVASM